jgi:anti-anti-sigma factor
MTEITISSLDKASVVKLKGRLDIAGVQKIELQFSEIGRKQDDVIIDLSGVEFCASFGMRMLLSTAKKLDSAGKKLILAGPAESVQAALEIAGLTTIMPIYATVEEALSSL